MLGCTNNRGNNNNNSHPCAPGSAAIDQLGVSTIPSSASPQYQARRLQKLQHSKLTQYRYMPGVMMVVNNCRYLPYNNSTLTWCLTLPYNESICRYANAVCKVVLVVWEMFMHLIVFAIISFKPRSNILMFTCVDVCFKFVCR